MPPGVDRPESPCEFEWLGKLPGFEVGRGVGSIAAVVRANRGANRDTAGSDL